MPAALPLFSKFLAAVRAGDNGLDERAAECTFFKGVDACDGRACRRANHGAQVARALAGLLDEFDAAFDGAESKLQCDIAGEACLYAAASKSFDEFKYVSGSTARESGDGVDKRFCNAASHADVTKDFFGNLERFFGDAVGRKTHRTLANSERQVRHHAEHLVLFAENFDEALAGNAGHDADERLFALERCCSGLPFGGDELENLRLDAKECDVSLFDAFGKALDADATEGANGFGGFVARVEEENVLGVGACVQKPPENGSAHVACAGKENRSVHCLSPF